MMKILKKSILWWTEKKAIHISIEMENYYFYIRTVDEDLKVYCFDEKWRKIKDTGMDFNEYMVDLVEDTILN